MTIGIGDNIIDSRDVIDRLRELEDERQDLVDLIEEADEPALKSEREEDLQTWDHDNGDELADMQEFADEGERATSEWNDGAAFINDYHFVEYAQDLAEDLGMVHRNVQWPYTCINWDEAAEELQADYTSINVGGETYWVRSC